jgi:hypothetical protein
MIIGLVVDYLKHSDQGSFAGVLSSTVNPITSATKDGPEFTSMAILQWSQQTMVEWHYLALRKTQHNVFVESSHGDDVCQ